jgi:hypothetical protein
MLRARLENVQQQLRETEESINLQASRVGRDMTQSVQDIGPAKVSESRQGERAAY